MALGLAALGWLACAGILDMAAAVPTSAATAQPDAYLHLSQCLVPLLAGVLFQSSVASRSTETRLRYAAALWGGWSLVDLAAAVAPHQLGVRAPWSSIDLGLQQIGIVIGLAIGGISGPALARSLGTLIGAGGTLTRAVIVAASVAILVLPLAPDTSLVGFASGWHVQSSGDYLKAVLNQIYLALKALILWVPLGMLGALAEKQAKVRAWAIAAVLAFLIVGLPLLHATLKVQDVLEILGAYWGIWLGTLVGMEVFRTLPRAAAEPLIASAPTSVPARGDAPIDSAPGVPAGALPRRIVAICLLLGVVAWSWFFPRWGLPLAVTLAAYAVLLWRYRHAWLFVVPAALPLLNLAPGSGRFFFDEFDLLLVTTVAMALWHGPGPLPRPLFHRLLAMALALFGVSIAASLVIGLLPLSPLDANAFNNYWSHYNSLRIAKGFLWAWPVLAMMRWTLPSVSDAIERVFVRLFVPGMWLGLAGVIAVGLWERSLFGGLFDPNIAYRITATFSSMHTGGSEIETYLVTAIPFVWLAFGHRQPMLVKVTGMALLVLGVYLMMLTVARGGVLALGVALCILMLGAWRAAQGQGTGKRATIFSAIAIAGVAGAVVVGLNGGYLQKRLGHVEQDWAVREAHWRDALAIRDRNLTTALFGMGLGRFPETYLYRSSESSRPGTYRFVDESGNRFLRLGSGETLYMAQRVPVTDNRRYALSLRVRSQDANARLGVPMCEKQLLDSFRCQWKILSFPTDGSWHALSANIDSGPVGSGNLLSRKPVELSLYNETDGTLIDVDDVVLQDDAGAQLIHNGDFSAGEDYWFFKTHSHLPWHIKNLWAEVLFEQGWFGLTSFLLLLATLMTLLVRGLWQGNRLATTLLAATGGLLTVGLFGSLFDTARITTLFFLLVLLAGTMPVAMDGRRPAMARPGLK